MRRVANAAAAGLLLFLFLGGAIALADCCQIPVVPPIQVPPDQKPPPPSKPPIQQDDKKPPTQDGGDQLNPIGPDGQSWLSANRARTFKEPVQQAVIAWNGKEELLILSVQQQSLLKEGTVLSVLPLPGKPISVERADPKIFNDAFTLYRNRLGDGGRAIGRDLKILIQRDIGAHHIVIVEAEDQKTFLGYVQAYVGKHVKNGAALFTDETKKVIQAYLNSGFKYFAFDLQKVNPELKVKEALAYRFETEWLYYPLAISRIGGSGNTKVQMFVVTPGSVNQYKGLSDKHINATQTVDLTADDLKKLDPTIAVVMGGPAKGRIWTILGKLEEFTADLFARTAKVD